MSSPLVSVVMPAFNAGRYIETSILSILNQSLSQFELIVVDDCSTDDTWTILRNIATKDARLKINRLIQNSGSAKYPREIAVQMASAHLICWIDSDDVVEPTYLEVLLRRYQETGADVVCSQMIAFQDDIDNVKYTLPEINLHNNGSKILCGEEAVMKTIGKQWTLNANGFLVRKELWLATSTFLDGKSFWMDVDDVSTREMLLAAKNVAFANVNYYYRIHPMAITKRISSKRFETLLTDECIIRLLVSYFGEKSVEANIARNQYINRILSFIRLYVMNKMYLSEEDKRKSITLIKESYESCTAYDVLTSDLKWIHKLIMLMPFPMALRIMKRINRQ